MNKPQLLKWKIAASLAFLALLAFVSSVSAQVTVTTANQTGTANTWPFTPTGSAWNVDQAHSLINGLVPSTVVGSFNLESQAGNRNVNSLTVNTNLTLNKVGPNGNQTTSTNYCTYGDGSGAGSLLVYTLPANANGYNITNISFYGGWADNGRDEQAYTVFYSTVANPTSFNFLAQANYNPSIPANTASAVKTIVSTPAGGVIANNVAAIEFVLNWPGVGGPNGNDYVGVAAITVGGTAASGVVAPVVSITYSNQSGASPFTPTWTAETPDLILGLAPSTANGTFTLETSGGTPVLTDGTVGTSGTHSTLATCAPVAAPRSSIRSPTILSMAPM